MAMSSAGKSRGCAWYLRLHHLVPIHAPPHHNNRIIFVGETGAPEEDMAEGCGLANEEMKIIVEYIMYIGAGLAAVALCIFMHIKSFILRCRHVPPICFLP